MKRRVILILLVVLFLGLIAGGIWYAVRRNQGPRILARSQLNLKSRQFDRALELARQYVAKYPGDWRGYFVEGQAQVGRAAYDDARIALEKARELNASDATIVIALSRTHSLPVERMLSSDNLTALNKAVTAFKKANELLDEWTSGTAPGPAPQKAAELDVKQEKGMNLAKEVAAHGSEAELYEKEAEAQKMVGNPAYALGQIGPAEKEATDAKARAREAEKEALDLLKEVVIGDPTRDRAGRLAIQFCIDLNDSESLSQIRQAIEVPSLKDRPPLSTAKLAILDLQRVPKTEDVAKKRDKTAELLDKLISNLPEEHPDRMSLVLDRASVALMQEQPEEALERCKQVLGKDPRQGQARLYRAKALIMQGDMASAERKLPAPESGFPHKEDPQSYYARAEQELLTLKTDFSKSDEAQYAYAEAAMKSGKPESAREAWRKIVREPKLNPWHRLALRSLTRYLFDGGVYGQAFVDARAYYLAYPDDPEALDLLVKTADKTDQPVLARSTLEEASFNYRRRPDMLRAVASGWELLKEQGKAEDAKLQADTSEEIQKGKIAEAEKRLYELKAKTPNRPGVHLMLGGLLEDTGRLFQAIEEYRAVVALDSRNDYHKRSLVLAYMRTDDLDNAEEVLRQFPSTDQWAKDLRRAIQLRKGQIPPDKASGLDAARSYLSIGQPEKCVQICQDELAKNPDSPNAEVRWILGHALLAQGKTGECLDELAKVLKAEPKSDYVYREIARIRMLTAAPEQIEAALRSIPRANQDLIDLTMGWVQDRRRDFRAAADYYGKVAERKETTEHLRNSARLLRAQSLANAGRTDEAILEAEKLTGAGPWQRQSLWIKAQLLLAAKRTAEAENVLRELYAAAVQTQDRELLGNIARRYAGMNQFDKALEVCNEMLGLWPNDAWVYMLKASALTDAGKLDQAADCWRQAIQSQPGNIDCYLGLARIMDLRQDSEQALEVLKQLENTGDAGRAAALSEKGVMFARWGLEAQAVAAYEELSKLGYGSLPRVRLALGRSFARLEMKDRARREFEAIPFYNEEYIVSRQLLAELADTTEQKLDILHRLKAERPGMPSVLTQEMQILSTEKRYAEAVAAYRNFTDSEEMRRLMPPEVSFIALQAMLNAGDNKSATDLSLRMTEWTPRSIWRHVAVLLLISEDPARAAKMLPQAAEADVVAALLGIASARQSGGPTKPWADRIAQINQELAKVQPPRSIPSHLKVLADLANGDMKEAETELDRFQGASTVGKNVAAELVSYAKSGGDTSAELANLIRSTVALDLGLQTVGRACALDVLKKRPECQWAAALVVQSMPDPATRRTVLQTLKPNDCVVAKMIQAAQAADEKAYAKLVEIYRSIADVEKENTEILVRLASAEALAGEIEKAVTIHQKVWQISRLPSAANNVAYLTAQLWPQDKAKLADAQTMIEAAIQAEPNVPAYLDTEAWIVHLRGDNARALRSLRQAVKGMPDSIEVHAHLGVVEAAAGNRQLASWHLASAVRNAERLKARGQELGLEQLQGLKIAQKALSDLGQSGK